MKGKSAIHIARTYMNVKRNFVGQSFWARGYFVSTVGRDEEVIRNYYTPPEVWTPLSWCSGSERFAGFGPLEGLGEGAVEVGDEGFDPLLQVLFAGEAGAAQQPAG